jgi:murein DD-endopeptidase / murein LD-carboxypeptidase
MLYRQITFIFLLFLITFTLNVSGKNGAGGKDSIDPEQQQLEWCFQYSNLLGYNITYINNPRLYQMVSEWIGVPYKYSGGSKQGIDCSGLVCNVYRSCYDRVMTGSAQDIFKTIEPIRKTELREGDLVFFKIRKTRISHVGIYLGQNRFVHASLKKGVIVSYLDDPYYSKFFYKGGRLKD